MGIHMWAEWNPGTKDRVGENAGPVGSFHHTLMCTTLTEWVQSTGFLPFRKVFVD